MSVVRNGLDGLLALVGVAAWSFAAFALGSRFFSPTAGALLGVGLLVSSAALVLSTFIKDQRLSLLADGVCPRCASKVSFEHRHRRWEPSQGRWQPPTTAWECSRCAYALNEAWPCPACPE